MRDAGLGETAWAGIGEDQGRGEGGDLRMSAGKVEVYSFVRTGRTISPRRARAWRSVGGASRCLSMPSKTSTNLAVCSSSRPRRTAKLLRFSQRPSMSLKAIVPCFSTSCLHASTVRSSRCLPVMHSLDLTMACGTSSACRTSVIARLFPVAFVPCTMIVGKLGMSV